MDFSAFTTFLNQLFPDGMTQGVQMYGWFSVAVLFLLLELSTTGLLFFFPFTVGGIISGLFAMFNYGIIVQSVIFLVISIISFVLMRYYFVKHKGYGVPTNTDALINKIGVVTKTIEPHNACRVKIKGEEWLAEASGPVVLHKGTYIHVVEVRGTKLIVK